MITYVNNSNAGQYRVLYEKATRDLMARTENNELVAPSEISAAKVPLITPTEVTAEELAAYEPTMFYRWDDEKDKYIVAEEAEPQDGVTYYKADDITSLNEYFSYIKNLAEIDPLYTVLPLDEDVFNVDLNTRKIDIPQHFKENGVSVQGDEIAEVVYFKVSRYFDAQDLAYMINKDDSYENGNENKDKMRIYIQWRSAQSGPDGKLIEGISVPWVVDMTTYPDYILFGWPISSKITGKEGTIDFAIRFFKFQDRNITYSLSTLTHSVTVKPSLDFDITEKIRDIIDGTENSDLVLDDNTTMILGRLANSEVIDGSAVAGKPYFFMVTNEGPAGIPLTTRVDSTVGNGTGIIEGNIQTSEGLVEEFWLAENPTTGILDQDTTFKVQGSGDGRISYSWKKLKNNPGQEDDKKPVAMTYTNEFLATSDTEEKPGKTYYIASIKDDKIAYELAPTPIIFDKTDPSYVPLFERFSVANITGVGYYVVTINNRVQNSLAKKESIEMVVARPLKPQNNTAVVNSGILSPSENYELTLSTDAEAQDRSVLTYQWYYSKDGEGYEAATPIAGATGSSYTIQGSGASSSEGADGDGYYYVIITSNMNKEQDSIRGNENGTRVTHPATKPVVTIPSTHKESYSLAEVVATGGMKVQYEISSEAGENRDLTKDSVTYQWYRYQAGDGHRVDADREAARRGEYVENEDMLLEGANEEVYVPQLGGFFYYCKVTNTYNGTTAEGYSPFFYITA